MENQRQHLNIYKKKRIQKEKGDRPSQTKKTKRKQENKKNISQKKTEKSKKKQVNQVTYP